MADDAQEARFRQHEDILRSLTAMLGAQHAMNQRMEAFVARQDTINEGVQTTLARVETLLARMIRHEDNGRDA